MSMVNSFLKYLGDPCNLTGYQRSYKLVFYKCFFERCPKNGCLAASALTQAFRQYYLDRKRAGLVPDINVDPVIDHIETSTLKQVYGLILKNPFAVIKKKGFFSLVSRGGEDYFQLNKELLQELGPQEIKRILAIVNQKLAMYFARIDPEQDNCVAEPKEEIRKPEKRPRIETRRADEPMKKPSPYKGNEPYIFVSYSHADSERVWPIILRLQQDGYCVWYDEGIDPGSEWDATIARKINGCRMFIVFISGNSVQSKYVRREIKHADRKDKPIRHIYLEECQLPEDLEFTLECYQAIFWHHYPRPSEAFAKLYETDGIAVCCADSFVPELPDVPDEHVWYACYGANMKRAHFMRYINACSDKTPPADDRPYVFPYKGIYFSKQATHWDNGGKAFLYDVKQGSAYGRIYKIKRKQFEEIKRMEGADYQRELTVGVVHGIDVCSFTDQVMDRVRTPSAKYFLAILAGLKECHGKNVEDRVLVQYLIDAIFPKNCYDVVKAIKKNPHYLTNREVAERTGLTIAETAAATTWLVNHGVIQQDIRSARAGHSLTSPEAFFFTVDSPCGRELIGAIMQAESEAQYGKR